MLDFIARRIGLAPASVATLLLQIASIGIVVCSNILLSRWLGDSAFARYSYIVSWLQLLAPVALFGLYELTLKNLSSLVAAEENAAVRAFTAQILRETLFFSLFIVCLMLAISFGFPKSELYQNRFELLIALPTVVFFAFIMQIQAILRCYNQTNIALLPEKLVRPALITAFVLPLFLYSAAQTAQTALICTTFSTFLTAAVSAALLYRAEKPLATQLTSPQAPILFDRRAQGHFLLLSALGIAFLRIDALLLGELGYIAQVGVYNTATRFTDLMIIVLQTMTFIVVPQYAVLAEKKEFQALQTLVRRTARTIFALTIPLFVGLLATGNFFLGIHSASFQAGYPILIILGSLNLLYALLGDNNYLLLMLGRTRLAVGSMLLGFACAIVIEMLLIPTYGMIGAAIGRAAGSLVFYLSTALCVWYSTGIVPSALPFRGKWSI